MCVSVFVSAFPVCVCGSRRWYDLFPVHIARDFRREKDFTYKLYLHWLVVHWSEGPTEIMSFSFTFSSKVSKSGPSCSSSTTTRGNYQIHFVTFFFNVLYQTHCTAAQWPVKPIALKQFLVWVFLKRSYSKVTQITVGFNAHDHSLTVWTDVIHLKSSGVWNITTVRSFTLRSLWYILIY